MAKSERKVEDTTEVNEDDFDQEALLDEDLSTLPPPQFLEGPWVLQWISSRISHGKSDKGPWTMIQIQLDPIEAAGEDREEIEADYNMEELPRLRHRIFYTTTQHKRDFVRMMAAFGVAAGELREMLSDAKGEVAVATLKTGKDNRQLDETKITNFRPHEVDMDEDKGGTAAAPF
jgi:hypothetical protein